MSSRDVRRYRRIPYLSPIHISWEDESGHGKYANANCLEISEGGLLIEVPVPIPVRTDVMLRAERINFAGSANVKHTRKRGSKFLLGVELSQPLREALASIRNSEALHPRAGVR